MSLDQFRLELSWIAWLGDAPNFRTSKSWPIFRGSPSRPWPQVIPDPSFACSVDPSGTVIRHSTLHSVERVERDGTALIGRRVTCRSHWDPGIGAAIGSLCGGFIQVVDLTGRPIHLTVIDCYWLDPLWIHYGLPVARSSWIIMVNYAPLEYTTGSNWDDPPVGHRFKRQ